MELAALLYFAIGFLALLLLIVLINIMTAPRLENISGPVNLPLVSLLIPARNEAKNIDRCLAGLLGQDYPNLEIIVIDDHSGDGTAQILARLKAQHPQLQLLSGQPLPREWTGKNWACWQLFQASRGKILIFADADTRHAPEAVRKTVGWMQHQKLGMLSAFLAQETGTPAEKLVIPVIDILIYSTLPLWLTYYGRSEKFAAANGQWIAFRRGDYQALGGHAAVRDRIVEDMELMRRAKRRGISTLTLTGNALLSCRMYRSAGEVWEGFSKNLFGIAGYNRTVFLGWLLVLWSAMVLPYFLLFLPGVRHLAVTAVGLNLLLRLLLALRLRHPFWVSLLLHPLGVALTGVIGLNSLFRAGRGMVRWKGREIPVRR